MTVNIRGMTRRGFVVTAFGNNGGGDIPLGGVVSGDILVEARNIVTGLSELSSFETPLDDNGMLRQTSTANLSGNEYDFYICPQS